ncbi:MAG: hypothetical protein ACERKN_14420 [Velocimicrobium sp.]
MLCHRIKFQIELTKNSRTLSKSKVSAVFIVKLATGIEPVTSTLPMVSNRPQTLDFTGFLNAMTTN